MKLIERIFGGKCKYWKHCKLYRKDSVTCNKTNGMYKFGTPASCYEKMGRDVKNEMYKSQR